VRFRGFLLQDSQYLTCSLCAIELCSRGDEYFCKMVQNHVRVIRYLVNVTQEEIKVHGTKFVL